MLQSVRSQKVGGDLATEPDISGCTLYLSDKLVSCTHLVLLIWEHLKYYVWPPLCDQLRPQSMEISVHPL